MRLFCALAAAAAGLLLGGCASPLRIPLAKEHQAAITDVKARVIVIQDEVLVAVQPSQVGLYTGGGLIGAVIDSQVTNARVKASQNVMGPFYAAIENVDFRALVQDAVGPSLDAYPHKVREVTVSPRALRQVDLDAWRQALGSREALMIVAPRYQLSMDFRSFDAEMFVTLWTVAGGNAPVQRSVVYYQSAPVGTGHADSVKAWSADGASAYRAAIQESVAETLRLALVDIRAGERRPPADSALKAFAFHNGAGMGQLRGELLEQDGRRLTVLGQDGKLYSLPAPVAAGATVAER